MLVSIIIPTYNRAHLIGETLDSVLAQTYTNWECIIVDDGSTDNTNEVVDEYVKKDSRFQYHHRPKDRPKGGNAARNYGFEVSKGDYVNWFDDDDVMLADFIRAKLSFFQSDEIQIVICSGFFVDENLVKIEKINLEIESFLFKDYVRWKLKIMTPSVLFKRTFLERHGLFDLNIFRGQETELFSRLFYTLLVNNYKILNTPLFLYRQHLLTKSTQNSNYIKLFKESQVVIAVDNFKRSIKLNDLDLIKYYYLGLVDFFFNALEFKHFKNCFYILKKGILELYYYNRILAIQFWIAGFFLVYTQKNSCRVKKYFKNYNSLR